MYANVTISTQYAFAAGSAFLSMDWCATGSNNIKLIFVAVALRTPWPKASGVGNLQPSGPELFVSSQLTKAFLVPHGGNSIFFQ